MPRPTRVRKPGFSLVFVALTLPGLLALSLVILESGQRYQRHTELVYQARESAMLGLDLVADRIEDRAEINKNNLCGGEEPPSVCSSTNRFDFLSETEIAGLLRDTDLALSLSALVGNSGQIVFPEHFSLGDARVRLRVLFVEEGLRAEYVSFLNLF